ncbi:MAG: metal-binding protein [Gammaproteobacteria bacterium]|nr:metal-binding protein [Gammaproteobacteria bacterium]
MASGRTHALITATLAMPTAATVGLLLSQGDVKLALIAGMGGLSGLLLHPDQDLDHLDFYEHRIIKWSWGLLAFWVGWWIPYGRLIPHRHWLSHTPFIGTIGRVMYLVVYLVIHYLVLTEGLHIRIEIQIELISIIYWVIGLSIADIGHWLADGMP